MFKFIKKYWPVAGIALILIVICFYWLKSVGEIGGEFDIGSVGYEDGLKLENIHYVQDDPDGGIKWTLDAGKVKFTEDNQRISFDNFKLSLSPGSGQNIKLSGDSGSFDRKLKKLELKGRLKGFTNDGYSIMTEHIIFRQDEGLLSSDESVDLSGPFIKVQGRGMRLDIGKMNLKILNNVTAFIDRTLLVP